MAARRPTRESASAQRGEAERSSAASPLRLQVFQHVPFEGLGALAEWARERGHTIAWTRLFRGETPPPLDALDALVVLGGPMGTGDEKRHPWLALEKHVLAEALATERPVLGICLGAQLVAEVLGAKVFANGQREVGWFGVERTSVATQVAVGAALPERFDAFHWHGDTFDLPAGAVHLARSAACENQAFLWEGRALALQFHLEVTPPGVDALVANCAEDLSPGPFVQTAPAMRAEPERFGRAHRTLAPVLDAWLGSGA